MPHSSNSKQAASVLVALRKAIGQGALAKTKEILVNTEVIHAIGEDGRMPLEWAVETGSVPMVELLLAHGAEVNAEDEFGETALFVAALNGNKALMYLLLEYGAVVNLKAGSGLSNAETPLHHAVLSGDPDVVSLLLSHGAKVTAKSDSGQTPLDVANAQTFGEIAALLQAHKENPTSGTFKTPDANRVVFQPCKGQHYKAELGELPEETWLRLGWLHSTVLFSFGTSQMSLSGGNLFSGDGDKVLPFSEYKSKMQYAGARWREAPLNELCAGFHVLLCLTGRCGRGAPKEPSDLGWPVTWKELIRVAKSGTSD